jgi:3-isopropylmalate/(R)-2-methylmalate dehydratase small subunit
MIEAVLAGPGLEITVELETQSVTLPGSASHRFEIDAYRKRCLMSGLDELAYTLTLLDRIEAFERDYS